MNFIMTNNQTDERMKKLRGVILSFLPLLILVIILIFLGFINRESEVYIDLIADKISFTIQEQDASTNLISEIYIKSLQLHNFDLKFKPGNLISGTPGKDIPEIKTEISITGRDENGASTTRIDEKQPIAVNEFNVPLYSRVEISIDEHNLQINLKINPDNIQSCNGWIFIDSNQDSDGDFWLSGRNLLISGLNLELDEDDDPLLLSTHESYRNIRFRANEPELTMALNIPVSRNELSVIVSDIMVNNISFVIVDLERRFSKEESTIVSGDIQIAGADFFGKRFLLKEVKLGKNEFLDIADDDIYYINSIGLSDRGLKISLLSEHATEVEKGKRITLLRSIFPSMLEYIVAEPSKKTFWTVIVFVIVQFATLKKFIKKMF